jgi:outer membrane protein TolC
VTSLETVLRLTETRNLQIALARKRVDEAVAAECSAGHCQLGRLLLHNAADGGEDGGSFGGGRYAAEAKTWQRRVELARTTQETLLDAGNTYLDLLTARRGEAIGLQLQKYQENLLRRAEDIAKTDRSAGVLVEGLRSEMAGRRASVLKFRQQTEAAATKLAYLLDLPPTSPVVPVDVTLEPIDLVDISAPSSVLVERAQSEGPGVRELSGLMATIEQGIAGVRPCLARLPRVAQQLQKAQFKLEETRLALDDIRGKLAAGILEAYGAIQSGRVQVADGTEHIRHAAETYRLSDLRLTQNAPGASTKDVSEAIRGLEFAHFSHVTAVAAYDKAQLRLFLLLGLADARAAGACANPVSASPAPLKPGFSLERPARLP